VPTLPEATTAVDTLARPLRQLRISVTDRCNFRCTYCMPREKYAQHRYLPRAELLSFEELTRTARVLRDLGVRKVRLTGGEPLLRRELPRLVERLADLELELALTTNGTHLSEQAVALRTAGLHRITLSLDALDDGTFQALADAPGYGVKDVLAGLHAAEDAGFGPIKINCVVRRQTSDFQIEPLVEFFRGTGHILRFIEYMDVGMRNDWQAGEVVSGHEILGRISERHALEPLLPSGATEVARRYRLLDGSLELGLITSISQPFCGDCDRLRLSADGQLYTCLFASRGHDIRALLRTAVSDEELRSAIEDVWSKRDDRYSALRSASLASAARAEDSVRRLPLLHLPVQKVEMPFIGG